MKKIFLIFILLISSLFLMSCNKQETYDIVTTAYPQYDFAKNIVKDKMTVKLLVKPGEEIHKYEVTSKDRILISKAKLFIYTSNEIDQWLKTNALDKTTNKMNLADFFTKPSYNYDSHDLIHYWVDPYIAIELIENIYKQIILIDPINKDFYEDNKNLYQNQILESISLLENFLKENSNTKTIYFAGHNALGLFGNRFNIEIISIHDDYKPDQDIVSKELISFINLIKENNIKYLFIEELVEPLAANKIKATLNKENKNLTFLELHAYHNVTSIDFNNNVTYNDIFIRNINNLMLALRGVK